jgi:hypothetical protein
VKTDTGWLNARVFLGVLVKGRPKKKLSKTSRRRFEAIFLPLRRMGCLYPKNLSIQNIGIPLRMNPKTNASEETLLEVKLYAKKLYR